jgi:hypothetical protein
MRWKRISSRKRMPRDRDAERSGGKEMRTSSDRVAFYTRQKPQRMKDILAYEQRLRDFVRDMAQALGKTLDEAVDYMERCGIVHPLEADYLKAHLELWGTL